MTDLSSQQRVQEEQYTFPFHYVPQFRNGFSTSVHSAHGLFYVSAMEFLLAQLKTREFGSLADIGCGDGRLVRELVTEFPGATVCGIDYSERSIHLARGFNPGLQFHCLDITRDEPGERFDLLTLIEVFEHIPPECAPAFVDGLHKLLRESGLLYVTVPHVNQKLSKKHYRHFTADTLRACFEPRFSIESTAFLHRRRGVRLFFIRRLLKNHFFLLNHRGLLNGLYRGYVKHCLHCTEPACRNILMVLRRRA